MSAPLVHCLASYLYAQMTTTALLSARIALASQTFAASYPVLHSQACLGSPLVVSQTNKGFEDGFFPLASETVRRISFLVSLLRLHCLSPFQ